MELGTVYVDRRTGSVELAPLVRSKAEVTDLRYGDFAFLGNGPSDQLLLVGIERKTVSDLLNSMTSGRLAGHQLPGMSRYYNHVYIIVEGIWRLGAASGCLEVPHNHDWKPAGHGSAFRWEAFLGYLTSLETVAGCVVRTTRSARETAQVIDALLRWWSKPYEQHRSIQAAQISTQRTVAALSKPSLVQRVAAELPGIGWGKSGKAAKRFKSVAEMLNATAEEWAEVEGIGKKLASTVVNAIRKEHS